MEQDMKASLTITALATALFMVAATVGGCDEEFKSTDGADYTTCENAADILNNQKVVCNDIKTSVEDLCGFSLTVDHCICAGEIASCTTDTAWLETIMGCTNSANDCPAYVLCLESVGESPSGGCDNPTEWDCIITEEPL